MLVAEWSDVLLCHLRNIFFNFCALSLCFSLNFCFSVIKCILSVFLVLQNYFYIHIVCHYQQDIRSSYKQAKFNLLREESEGYAKLITELMDAGGGIPAKTMMTRVLCLIGEFDTFRLGCRYTFCGV